MIQAMSKRESSIRKQGLVIGGSRGIGRAVALRLARSGFDICLTYHQNRVAAEKVGREIEQLGRECECLAFDVGDHEATELALAERIEASSLSDLRF
jgi:3-oxoacyl-[acyl-carrier protein] reductase